MGKICSRYVIVCIDIGNREIIEQYATFLYNVVSCYTKPILDNAITLIDHHVHTYNSFDSYINPFNYEKVVKSIKSKIQDIIQALSLYVKQKDHEDLSSIFPNSIINVILGFVDHNRLPYAKHYERPLVFRFEKSYVEVFSFYGSEQKLKDGCEIIAYTTHSAKQSSSFKIYYSLPHPFKRSCPSLATLVRRVDFIELFNGRTTLDKNVKAFRLWCELYAVRRNVFPIAGSDAHIYNEILDAGTAILGSDVLCLFYKLKNTLSIGCSEALSQLYAAFKTRSSKRIVNSIVILVKGVLG